MTLHTYIPQDRLRALAHGTPLPDRTSGSALFADISGFTPLTERLHATLGTRRGVEELTRQLDAVYTALIAVVERYGGSVIAFAGDAIACWFDDAHGSAAPRAAACACALQAVMQTFSVVALPDGTTTALALKVAVATGPARRFIVGDPQIHYIDALAGATVVRTATAEHLAQKGDVLVDDATAQALGDALVIHAWRMAESGERFGVVHQLSISEEQLAAQPVFTDAVRTEPALLRPFILPAIYARAQTGLASFFTEFRPCAVLFVRFVGIDYDAADAQTQLDVFIQYVQRVAAQYDGIVLQVIVGDKGSYLYVNFGALNAHEDDARRAVKAAIELQQHARLPIQLGLTYGVMRVGTYGGATRRTYGALGDDVNLAARLMQVAAPGEILVSAAVQKAVTAQFDFAPRAPLQVKGKDELVPVSAVTGQRQSRALRLQEPRYVLPMVGRETELETIRAKLALARESRGQIIGIVAEAGVGKSRLVAEAIRAARAQGFAGYGGTCQSDAVNTPYHAWKTVWQAFFDVDPAVPATAQARLLEAALAARAPERLQAFPLLGLLLNLDLPENDFTKNLEPKIRQSALQALLEACLKAAAKDEPLLIVIEDLHWIDALSHDLLEQFARALTHHCVCFLLAYRPPQLERLQAPRLEALAQFTKIELHELTHAEAEHVIHAKLAQVYPTRGGAVPHGLVDTLMARAQGNPFYLEELLNYMRDHRLDPADLHRIELPDSLHTLILSRIDRLSEHEQTTLRVASIIGRLFRAQWLTGYYPELGTFSMVKASLDELEALEIIPLDTPEPELTYLFKHIVTHEVTYESLSFATRAKLHEQLALYLESVETQASLLETLAFHYGRSENSAKQIEYLRKAGEAAQKHFSNAAALDFYGKLLPLLKEAGAKEQLEIHLKRGEVYEFIGNYAEAESDYRVALELAKDDVALKVIAQFALGKLSRQRGDYASALEWLAQTKQARSALADNAGLAQALIEMGEVFWRKGEFAQAHEPLNAGLALAREVGDTVGAAQALNNLGNVAWYEGDYATAQVLYGEGLNLYREIGDKRGIAASLNNLGIAAGNQGDYAAARRLFEESLSLKRETGEKVGVAMSLGNIGVVALTQGDYVAARALSAESLTLFHEIGDKRGVANSLSNLGVAALALDDYTAARALHEESLSLRREMSDKRGIASSLFNLGFLAIEQQDYALARTQHRESLMLAQATGEKRRMLYNLAGLATVACGVGALSRATQLASATETQLTTAQITMESFIRRQFEHTLLTVREQVDATAFQPAWEAGAGRTLEEAVQQALEEDQ